MVCSLQGPFALTRQGAQVTEAKQGDALTTLERNIKTIEQALARGDHDTIRRVLEIGSWDHRYDGRLALTKGAQDLAGLRLQHHAHELRDPQATHDRASLPSATEALAFARYEAQLHRQLHRALFALERLQRQRAGEAVPPPIAVDVTITPAAQAPRGPSPTPTRPEPAWLRLSVKITKRTQRTLTTPSPPTIAPRGPLHCASSWAFGSLCCPLNERWPSLVTPASRHRRLAVTAPHPAP